MKSRNIARILAALVSAAVIMPSATLSYIPVSAAVSANASWNVSVGTESDSIPSYALEAFERASMGYSGGKLTPLACYGQQVVAGMNYAFICRLSVPGGEDVLKKVIVYDDLESDSIISSVDDFDLNDYAKDNYYELPEYPVNGGMEVITDLSKCELPDEVKDTFDSIFEGMCGASIVPIAYLGKQTTSSGTDYAILCQTSAVVPEPDYYIDVLIIHQNPDGQAYSKSNYSILGTRTAYPVFDGNLTYEYSGNSSSKSGYAQGTIKLTADNDATYKIYWADENKALDGFYPIAELKMKSGETKSVSMGYHTVIPAKATRLIATTTDSLYTSDAYSVCDIKPDKRFNSYSGELLYSFSTYSDIHIDKGSLWYVDAEKNFKQALNYSTGKNVDYIIVSGDCVTNDSGPDKEWDAYAKILSKSDYVNPIWESDGNHDLRQGVESGLKSFIKGSGTDGSQSGKSYFYMEEEKTGDIFLFMSLEMNKAPNKADEFSDEQIAWATKIIEDNYQNKNIFLVQHSPIEGFGAGDRMSKPYYSGMLNPDDSSTKKFKALLKKYPNIVFLSGHTHQDFVMDYNYSDENGTAANMIHTPSLAGSTMPDSSDTGLERNGGKGFNSQGYYVEVYENEIVFYGANITDEKIYPQYSYIMEGSRDKFSPVNPEETKPYVESQLVDSTAELTKVASILSSSYKYASYDSYQALKKLYYKHKNEVFILQSVIDEFEELIKELSQYTGDTYYSLYDTYYFVNNYDWSSVYAYAWTGSSKNAEWPGVKLSKVGVNSDNKDVYAVKFNNAGEYENLIFDVGSNSKQTVDIALSKYQYNGFYIGGTDNGKYTVKNFEYDPTGKDKLALLYYVTDDHDWSDIDSFFECGSDGIYRASFEATSNKSFSFSLYNKTSGKYYTLSESVKLAFEGGKSEVVTLEEHSSRGKSVTISGLSAGDKVDIEYNPGTNKVTVTCGEDIPELVNTSTMENDGIYIGEKITVNCSAKGGQGNYTYTASYKRVETDEFISAEVVNNKVVITPETAGMYDLCIIVTDSSGTVVPLHTNFTVSAQLKNTSTLDKSSITVGESVNVNCSAEGGTAPYKYAFMSRLSGTTSWKVIGTKYGTSAVEKFTATKGGTYEILASIKDATGKTAAKKFIVTVTDPSVLVSKSTINTENATCGTKIILTGAAEGGASPYLYTYQYQKPDKSSWITLGEKYGTEPSANFTPKTAGTYKARVLVKDANGKIQSSAFTITITGQILENKSVISAWGINVNGSVTVTAKTNGGTTPFYYTYEYKKSGDTKWTTIGKRNSTNTKSTVTLKEAGEYEVKSLIKDASGFVTSKIFKVTVS